MNLPVYTRTAAAIHWLQVLLLIVLVTIGLTMVELPKGADRSVAFALHKSLGLLALLLIVLRLGWRLRVAPPPHPGLTTRERFAAQALHRLLYLLLILVPVSGLLAIFFTPYPLKFFGLPLPKPGWPDGSLNHLFTGLHHATLILLGAALLLHVAAVVRHLLRGDGTLRRMLPPFVRWNERPRRRAAPASAAAEN